MKQYAASSNISIWCLLLGLLVSIEASKVQKKLEGQVKDQSALLRYSLVGWLVGWSHSNHFVTHALSVFIYHVIISSHDLVSLAYDLLP